MHTESMNMTGLPCEQGGAASTVVEFRNRPLVPAARSAENFATQPDSTHARDDVSSAHQWGQKIFPGSICKFSRG